MDATIGKGPTVIDYAIEHVKQDPQGEYGPWLLGLMGVTLVVGIITSQAVRYFSTFKTESRAISALVVLSLVLTLAHWIVIVHGGWTWFVLHFGDYRAFAVAPWQSWTAPIIGQGIVTTSQVFFAHRCYTLYHRSKILLICLLFGMLGSLVFYAIVGALVATDPFNYWRSRRFAIPAVCLTLVTDLAIAGLTLWKLGVGGGKSYSPNTNDVLQRLRNLTVEAAVPPAISALINMSVYINSGQKNLAFVAFGVITPGLYVCSMLFTLNSRRAIRRRFNNPNDDRSLNGGFELSSFVAGRRTRQTESRRTTIVFAPTTGPSFAPNASIGIVHERVEGSEDKPAEYRRRGYDDDDDDDDDDEAPTSPGASHKELQVDLDKWETHGLKSSRSRSTLGHPDRIPEPPPVATIQDGNVEYGND